jgi:hypothetical protein
MLRFDDRTDTLNNEDEAMKTLSVLCFLGLLVSFGASVYSSRTYLLHSLMIPGVEANAKAQRSDIMLSKIESLSMNSEVKQLITNELKSRREISQSYLDTLRELSTGTKSRALVESIAWVCVTIIFFVMQLLLRLREKQS